MDCITFSDVSFAYPAEEAEEQPHYIFSHFSGSIPPSFTVLIGPNGSGKSTFLMLASGRLIPQEGQCLLFEEDVAHLDENTRSELASVIYQNMEFDEKGSVSHLLGIVYNKGTFKGRAQGLGHGDLLAEVIEQFELSSVLDHGLMKLSKGELQRVLLAFSMLYGSAAIFMDEPFFALEPRQKESALAYLRDYAARTGTAIFICMHELDLARKYAQNVMLFYPNRDIDFGTPDEVMTNEALEKAYGVPVAMLKKKEDLTREELLQAGEAILQMQRTKA